MTTDHFEVVLLDRGREVLVYKRWDEAGGVVVVAANLRDDPAGDFVVEGKGLDDGTWREQVGGADVTVGGGRLCDFLGPSDVRVYVKR